MAAPQDRDPADEILDRLLESLERGEALDLDAIAALHPGHESTVARLALALDRYRASMPRAGAGDELAAGTVLGDFVVDRRLAVGGMGVVYRARQRSLGSRPVALKLLREGELDATAVARFRREALAAASVHHPNLAEIYGFGEQDGLVYYAMQLVDGPTLRDILARLSDRRRRGLDPPPTREVVECARSIADALAALHEHGLAHRDVKPSNVMLERASAASAALDRRPVLVDFGLARRLDSQTLTLDGASAATPAYAAPEQLLGIEVDARADVFSLGATLHDLLARRTPDERLRAAAGLEPIESLASEVDRDLAAVVARCVERNPAWRYANGAQARDDLTRWLAGEAVAARRLGMLEATRRWIARRPMRAALALLAAVTLIATLWLASREIARGFELAATAHRASEVGDPSLLRSAVTSIPAWLAPLVLDNALERRRREASARTSLPWIDVAEWLDADEPKRALLDAARAIQRGGFDREPLLVTFLLRAASSSVLRLDDPRGSSVRRDAIRHLQRVMTEAEPFPRDHAARAALVEPIVRLLSSPRPLAPLDRELLVSALSRASSIEHLPHLLDLWTSGAVSSEERRLISWGVHAIALRGLANARGVPMIEPALDVRVLATFEPAWSAADTVLQLAPLELHQLTPALYAWNALVRASRAGGDVGPMPESFWSGFDAPTSPLGDSRKMALASRGDPRIRRVIERAQPRTVDDAGALGSLCAWLGDDRLTDAVRAACAAKHDEPLLVAFESAWRRDTRPWLDRFDTYIPDRETWLCSPPDPTMFGCVENRFAAACADTGPAIAVWHFNVAEPCVAGWARSAEWSDARISSDRPLYFLLLSPREGAEVDLRYVVPDGVATRALELAIVHQGAWRWHQPRGGIVALRIEVDGELVSAFHATYDSGGNLARVTLTGPALSTGEHVIRIAIEPEATTTVRVMGACLLEEPADLDAMHTPWLPFSRPR